MAGIIPPRSTGQALRGATLGPMSERTTFVVGALLRRGGRLLLVEEREPADPQSTWMLPGGRVEAGELLVEALRRELAEETGLRLIDEPRMAFLVDIVGSEGGYSAITFDCAAEGTLEPNDPDGLVMRAEWVEIDEALERLACVSWYDCAPLERFLSGEAPAGATYVADRT